MALWDDEPLVAETSVKAPAIEALMVELVTRQPTAEQFIAETNGPN